MAVRIVHPGGRFSARLSFALVVFAIVAPLAQAQLPCRYEVTVLPEYQCGIFHGAGNPVAINNLGLVVLTTASCGIPSYNDTLIWTGGPTMTLIPRPPGMLGVSATDLNDNGVIVGIASFANNLGQRATVYDLGSGGWTILDPPVVGGQSGANAISNDNPGCRVAQHWSDA